MGEQTMRTPPWLVETLEQRVGYEFQLDAAAEPHNAICRRFLTARQDGTKRRWIDRTFCNPPFAMMEEFTRHAHEQALLGIRSVMIAPIIGAQTWARKYVQPWTELRPNKRISYLEPDGKPTDGANRDTSIILYGPGYGNPHAWPRFHVINLEMPR